MLSRILYTDKYSINTDVTDVSEHYAKQTLSRMLNSGIYDSIEVNFDITSTITRDEMIQLVNRIIYPKDLGNLDKEEDYLVEHEIYKDLTSDSHDRYYEHCLKAIDKGYVIGEFGGSI